LFIHVYPPVVLTVIRWVNSAWNHLLGAGSSLPHADLALVPR
jgi:hypothetical protein